MVEVVTFLITIKKGLVKWVLRHKVALKAEVPSPILGDGIYELKLQRHRLKFDVKRDRSPVPVALTITTMVASLTGRAASAGLRALRVIL